MGQSYRAPSPNRWLSIKPAWVVVCDQLRPIHLYLLYIFIIICTVKALSYTLSGSELQASRSQTQKKYSSRLIQRDQILLNQSEN